MALTKVSSQMLSGNSSSDVSVTSLGVQALNSNTSGTNNTAVGNQAGYSNTTGGSNTFVGQGAGYTTTTASNSVMIGDQAGYLTTGGYNQFVGDRAGYNVTTGTFNHFFGQQSGFYVTTGSNNVILGAYSGNASNLDIRTSNYNVVLSDGGGNPRTIIGSDATQNEIGNGSSVFTSSWGSGGTVSTSIYFDINYNTTNPMSSVINLQGYAYPGSYINLVFGFYATTGFAGFTGTNEILYNHSGGVTYSASVPAPGIVRIVVSISGGTIYYPAYSVRVVGGGYYNPVKPTVTWNAS